MSTVLDDVSDAIRAALAPVVAPNDVEMEPAGDPDAFPALDLMINGWRVLEREANLTRRELSFTVGGYVERGDGLEASQERAELHAAAVAAIMTDPTLGGLVELTDDGDLRMHTAVLASVRRLAFAQDFVAQLTTSSTNPALPA